MYECVRVDKEPAVSDETNTANVMVLVVACSRLT